MKSVISFFRPTDGLLLVVSVVLVGLYLAAARGGFPLDDSWIHQTYGRNLAETGQWAFVPGVLSAASTSPLYTVLLAVGYKLGIFYKVWTHGWGLLALWAACMAGARMAERLLPGKRLAGVLAGLAVVLNWHLIWAAVSGMETMLFSMWTLVLLAIGWRELDERSSLVRHVLLRGGVFGAVAALTTLTRPEGIMLAGFIGLVMLAVRPQGSWRGVILWGMGAAVGFLIVSAPYLAYNVSVTGGLLPDTAAAKQAQNAPVIANFSYFRRLWEMVKPLLAGVQLLLIPSMIYYVMRMTRRSFADRNALLYLLPLVWAAALILLYAAQLPAPYQHGRYVIPVLPSVMLMGVVGTIWLIEQYRNSLMGRVLTRSLAITSIFAVGYFALSAGVDAYRRDVAIIDEEMVTAAHWIADNIPPEETLAVHDIGAVGYFAPRPILDLAGLVSPEIVPFINDAEPLWDWLRENDARYLMAFPDQIPGDTVDDPRLCEVFNTNGTTSRSVGGPSMVIYDLQWDRTC